MKLITFTTVGFSRIGAIVEGGKIVDLNYAYQAQLCICEESCKKEMYVGQLRTIRET